MRKGTEVIVGDLDGGSSDIDVIRVSAEGVLMRSLVQPRLLMSKVRTFGYL